MPRTTVHLLWAAMLLGGLAPPAWAGQSVQIEQPDDNQLRLLKVQLAGHSLDDLVPAYQRGDRLLLPLGMLSRTLGLAITTHPETGMAEGFILQEQRGFLLDVERGEVTINGVRRPFDSDRAHLYPDDIYVEAPLLAEWFPLRLDVNLLLARLQVEPLEPFPLQQRLDRERRSESLKRVRKKRDLPVYDAPYRLFDVPFVDQTLQLGRTQSTEAVENAASYTAYGTGDLLYMQSAWYLAADGNEGLNDWRLTLGRADPRGGLLGPLDARRFALGHLTNPGIDLVSTPRAPAPGVVVSTYPLGQQTQFDTHTFEGDLPPGWEVELYHNNALIGYARPDTSGRYQFDQVPLLFGNNHFRLVFYGPEGQRREVDKSYVLGRSLVRPGKQYWRAFRNQDQDHRVYQSLQYDAGLSHYLTASLSASSQSPLLEPGQRHYLAAGLRAFWDLLYLKLDAVDEKEGGQARELSLQTRLGPVNLSLSDTRLRDFASDLFPDSIDPVRRRSTGRVDFALPATRFTPHIPVVFEAQRDLHESGRENSEYRNRISTAVNGLALTNALTLTTATDVERRLDGLLRVSYQRQNFGLRSELYYLMAPQHEPSSVVVTLDTRHPEGYHWTYGVDRSFASGVYKYRLGLSQRHGAVGYSLNATHSTDGQDEIYLALTMGIGRDPASERWYTDARPQANNGAFSASAFLDTNRNGQRDAGEALLRGVDYKVNGGYRPFDGDGASTLVTGLPANRKLDIRLDEGTLTDPLWVPELKGVNTVLRPGHVTRLEFPVVMTGEIDGTTYMRRRGRAVAIGGVELELVDPQGAIIRTTRSAYDGFYLFSQVPLGEYHVRVAPEQARRLNLAPPTQVGVGVSAEEFIASNNDLVLRATRTRGKTAAPTVQ